MRKFNNNLLPVSHLTVFLLFTFKQGKRSPITNLPPSTIKDSDTFLTQMINKKWSIQKCLLVFNFYFILCFEIVIYGSPAILSTFADGGKPWPSGSWLHQWSAGDAGVYCHSRFMDCWGFQPGLREHQANILLAECIYNQVYDTLQLYFQAQCLLDILSLMIDR